MDRETFADACLQALNDELEGFAPVRYTVNPHACFLGSMLTTFSIDDIRQMVAFKRRQWEGTQYQAHLSPNTLLSPYHFEAYIADPSYPQQRGRLARPLSWTMNWQAMRADGSGANEP